jgi:hypothetical protein
VRFFSFVCLIFETILKVHLYANKKDFRHSWFFECVQSWVLSRLDDSKNSSSFVFVLELEKGSLSYALWVSGMIFMHFPEVKILRSFMLFMGSFIGYLSSFMIFIVTMKGLVLDFTQSKFWIVYGLISIYCKINL